MALPRLAAARLTVPLAQALLACPSIGQFRALEKRVDSIEKAETARQSVMDTLQGRIQNLYGQLKQQGGDLRGSGVALSSEMDGVSLELRRLEGHKEETDFRLSHMRAQLDALSELLDERFGLNVSALPGDLPDQPGALMERAEEYRTRNDLGTARAIWRALLRRHPKHRLAAQAQLRVGESYAREGKTQAALRELSQMERRFGKTSEMAEAYLLVGALLQEQGACVKALAVYELFLDRVPKHARRQAVTNTVASLRKDPSCKRSAGP